jgi:uncharacterized membrane protein YtjA (UPF0391 family)
VLSYNKIRLYLLNVSKTFQYSVNVHYSSTIDKGTIMLHYTVVFFVIAIIAAVFGFGGIAAGATEIAKILFFVFLVITIISFLVGKNR